jgi:tetratricopeptide (TPR) repeat protein
MPQFHSAQIPPPKSWQEFEELCSDLWGKVFDSPNTELNGRTGQSQCGVDVSGLKGGSANWFGVQCKGKDGRYGDHHQVTKQELIDEVAKAKKFMPAISHFILATTAPNDAKIQQVARNITAEHAKHDLFIVQVKSWDEILRDLAKYQELVKKYYPGFANPVDQLSEEVVNKLKQEIPSAIGSVTQLPDSKLDDAISKQIDGLRDLLINGQPQTALKLLEKLKDTSWSILSNYNKFRVITNIAASHLNLGNPNEAARLFFEANTIEPQDEKSLCNLVVAHHLLGDDKEAKEASEKAVKNYPNSTMAHRLRVTATHFDENDSPEALVPKQLHHMPEICFAVGHAYLNMERVEDAISWLEKGYNDEYNNFPDIKPVYATALLKKLYEQKHLAVGMQFNQEDKQTLNLVNTIFTDLWDEVKTHESISLSSHHITNLLLTKFLLNDLESGVTIAKTALAKIKDDDQLFLQTAFILMDASQFEAAINLISKYYDKDPGKWALLYTDALARDRRFTDALGVIQAYLSQDGNIDKKEAAFGVELKLLATINTELSEEKVNSALNEFPESIFLCIDLATAFTKTNQIGKAIEYTLQAKNLISEHTSYIEKRHIADELFDLEEYKDAISLYEELVVEYVDSDQLRKLIQCYYLCNYRRKLHDLLDSLPDSTHEKGFYRLYAAATYEVSGEYNKALAEHEAYLDMHQTDLRETLRWFSLCQRLNKEDNIVLHLRQAIEYGSSNPIDYMNLAAYQCEYLDFSVGIKLATDTTLNHYEDPDVNMAYVQLFLSRTEEGDSTFNQDVVENDTNVCLESKKSGKASYFISDKNKALGNPIPTNHSIALSAVGKKVGDIIEVKETPYTTNEYTIQSITGLSVFLFQSIMGNFSARFPNYDKAFFSISVKGASDGEYDFSDFFKVIDGHQKHTTEVLTDYKTQSYPIFVVAKLLGKSPLDVWLGMQADPVVKVFSCIGTHKERDEALRLLGSTTTFIVDPLTLHNLFTLSLLEKVVSTVGQLAVTQSCIDFYNYLIVSKKSELGKKGGIISKTDAGYVNYDHSNESTEKSIDTLRSIVDWVTTNCIIAAAIENDTPSAAMQLLSEVFDRVFYDTLVAAEGNSYHLLSDDLRFRQLSKFACKIDGVWLQPILIKALQDGAITRLEYAEFLVELAQRGLYFVSVDSISLINILESNQWQVTPSFVALLSTFGEESNDLHSSVAVLVELLFHVITSDNFEHIAYVVLSAITRDYCHSQSENIINFFIQLGLRDDKSFGKKFNNRLLEAIYKWCEGRFIVLTFFRVQST